MLLFRQADVLWPSVYILAVLQAIHRVSSHRRRWLVSSLLQDGAVDWQSLARSPLGLDELSHQGLITELVSLPALYGTDAEQVYTVHAALRLNKLWEELQRLWYRSELISMARDIPASLADATLSHGR